MAALPHALPMPLGPESLGPKEPKIAEPPTEAVIHVYRTTLKLKGG